MFGKLEGQEFLVEEEKLEVVKNHLKSLDAFETYKPNQAMFDRLQKALNNNQKINGADACFYTHELKESELMKNGAEWDDAHNQAINYYDVSPYSLYHPEVVNAYPDEFNSNWKKFWGIE